MSYDDNSPRDFEKSKNDDTHLEHFWKSLTFKILPKTAQDINMLVQVEMMRYHTKAPICKIFSEQYDRCLTGWLVSDKKYFCSRSKYFIKDEKIKTVIDLLYSLKLQWHVKTNIEGNSYLFASWQHWDL